jgi:hypothetical protein
LNVKMRMESGFFSREMKNLLVYPFDGFVDRCNFFCVDDITKAATF